MGLFSSSEAESAKRLREVLDQVKRLIERSEQSDWTPFAPSEIATDLSAAISRLDRREAIEQEHLEMLFAPTGPIQETAMSAGWSDEYLKLSTEFDVLIRQASGRKNDVR